MKRKKGPRKDPYNDSSHQRSHGIQDKTLFHHYAESFFIISPRKQTNDRSRAFYHSRYQHIRDTETESAHALYSPSIRAESVQDDLHKKVTLECKHERIGGIRAAASEHLFDVCRLQPVSAAPVHIRIAVQIEHGGAASKQIRTGCSGSRTGHSHMQRADKYKIKGKIGKALHHGQPHQHLHSS